MSDVASGVLLMTERDAAKLLAVSPRTLFNWRKRGMIKAVRLGASVRYEVEDLMAFVNSMRVDHGKHSH